MALASFLQETFGAGGQDAVQIEAVKNFLTSNPLRSSEEAEEWAAAGETMLLESPTACRFRCETLLLKYIYKDFPQVLHQRYSAEKLRSLAPPNLIALSASQAALLFFSVLGSISKVFHPVIATATRPLFLTLLETALPIRVPPLPTQVAIVTLWNQVPNSIPVTSGFHTDVIVRWIALVPKGNLANVNALVGAVEKSWVNDKQSATLRVLHTLQIVFMFLAGTPLLRGHLEPQVLEELDTATRNNQPFSMKKPSPVGPAPALCQLVQRFPTAYISEVPQYIANAARQLPQEFLLLAVERMLQWPLTEKVSPWVLGVLEGLCRARQFELLAEVTRKHVPFIIKQLYSKDLQMGSLKVLRRLLLGYQHSEDAFHLNLPPLIELTRYLAASQQSSELLANFTNLPTSMLNLTPSSEPQSLDSSQATVTTSSAPMEGPPKAMSPKDNQESSLPSISSSTKLTSENSSLAADKPLTAAVDDSTKNVAVDTSKPSNVPEAVPTASTAALLDSNKNNAPINALAAIVAAFEESKRVRLLCTMYCNMLSCLMYKHHGYPEQYLPLIESMADFKLKPPGESTMQAMLTMAQWAGTTESDWSSFRGNNVLTKSETGYSGLGNLGNTCYLNSVVQSLFMTETFRRRILTLRSDNAIVNHLKFVFGHLMLTDRPFYTPASFLSSLPRTFNNRMQQDATEFAKFLLDEVTTALSKTEPRDSKRPKPGAAPDSVMLVDPYFGGVADSRLECLTCNKGSVKSEPFNDIDLAFPLPGQSWTHPNNLNTTTSTCTITATATTSSTTTLSPSLSPSQPSSNSVPLKGKNGPLNLYDLIHMHFCAEVLSGENAVTCSTCNSKQSFSKALSISKCPDHLVVSLKRHAYDFASHTRTKIMTEVKYPCLLRVPVQTKGGGKSPVVRTVLYSLYSVVVHSGSSAQFGHYYAIARPSEMAAAALDSLFSRLPLFKPLQEGYTINAAVSTSPSTSVTSASILEDPNDKLKLSKLKEGTEMREFVNHPRPSSEFEKVKLDEKKEREDLEKNSQDQREDETEVDWVRALEAELGPHELDAAVEAQARLPRQWCNFNDRVVSPSSYDIATNITASFPNDLAYLLFYRRLEPPCLRHTRPSFTPEESLSLNPQFQNLAALVREDAKRLPSTSSSSSSSSSGSRIAPSRLRPTSYTNFSASKDDNDSNEYYDPDQ